MPTVHRTAIVDPRAELASDVQVGPYAIIEGHVRIGPGGVILPHTIIHGNTRIGANCRMGPNAFIGLDPQHLRYDGAPTWLIIGDNVTVREVASVHRSIREGEDHATLVGDNCYIMSAVHVGHDSRIGRGVIISSAALIGGHCQVDDGVFIGGDSALHQFVRVGRLAIIAGQEGASRDIPPFAAVRYHGMKAYNAVGCRRSGMPFESIKSIRAAYYCIHHHRNLARAVEVIRARVPATPEVRELLAFIASTRRGIHPSVHFRRLMHDTDD